MSPLREPLRQTWLIDDFGLWDKALHDAVSGFRSTYQRYPTFATVHPEALRRFGARVAIENLRDAEGEVPDPDTVEDVPHLEVFETADYAVELTTDAELWPVQLVLWSAPAGEGLPAEDTWPPANHGRQTQLSDPMSVRRAWGEDRAYATQCISCRNLLTPRRCRAFPDGIPLDIAQSRHDHAEPFPGDGGVRFERSLDGELPLRATRCSLFGDLDAALEPWDAPDEPTPPTTLAPYVAPAPPWDALDVEEVRAQARAALSATLAELGGVEQTDPDALIEAFLAGHPVTAEKLRTVENNWFRHPYIRRWFGSKRSAAKRKRGS